VEREGLSISVKPDVRAILVSIEGAKGRLGFSDLRRVILKFENRSRSSPW